MKCKIAKSQYKKKTIDKELRTASWHKYNGNKRFALCHCCKNEVISRKNWQCGHVKSEKTGGLTILKNLRPICSNCNFTMKTKNLKTFKRTMFPETCDPLFNQHGRNVDVIRGIMKDLGVSLKDLKHSENEIIVID
jgi:hypothetical protein